MVFILFPAGTLLVMGGYNSGGGQASVWQYDVYAGTVIRNVDALDMPFRSWFTGSTQQYNTIYTMGGRTAIGNTWFNSKQVHRFQWGLWGNLPSLSEERLSPCPFILRNKLYITGGNRNTSAIEALDLTNVNAGWEPAGFSMPFRMNNPASATIKDSVFLTYANYLLKYQLGDYIWSALMNMSVHRYGHCMVSDGESRLWVLGGEGTLSVEMFDLLTGWWTEKAPIPHNQIMLSGHGCVFHDSFIYVVGGFGTNFFSNVIYVYNIEKDSWTHFSVLPEGRSDMSLGILTWG